MSNEVNINTPSLVPVHDWHIDTTSLGVAMRLCADGSPDGSVAAGEHGFVMTAEQARQVIRDLSAAVLASDLDNLVEGRADAV
ncbi:hypothetical protein PQR75_46820 [Paraburkholderia fungorum]|uniref:hypothetical protein n=1 Tax=Paraburkholderia fungorum TaxID=134537 RepID=UPI0038BA243B